MNAFIDTFLDILLRTLSEMNTELKEKVDLINKAEKKIMDDTELNEKKHRDFIFILAQNHFFHNNDGLTVKELAQELDASVVTVRKVAKELLEKSIIEQKGIRPAYFVIDPQYFEN